MEDDDEEEKKKWERPPSSYGSMKSDSEGEEEKEEEDVYDEEVAKASTSFCPVTPPGQPSAEGEGYCHLITQSHIYIFIQN